MSGGSSHGASAERADRTRRRLLALAPLGLAAAAGTGFWSMLSRMNEGGFDPHDIHAPVLDRAVPGFDLPGPDGTAGFSDTQLRAQTVPILVNLFASWCVPCVMEAPVLAALKGRLPVWGIAYKDRPEDAAGFVARTGQPYARLAADRDGLCAIDWGASGVPENFLIRPGGIVAWHLAGPLTPEIVSATLLPLAAGLSR